MEQEKIDMFLAMHGNKFPEEKYMFVRDMLAKTDEQKFNHAQVYPFKDPTTMLIVSLLGGSLGIDRFMLNETGKGVGKLILTAFCLVGFIWVIVDWFNIQKDTKEFNFLKLSQLLM